MAVERAEIQTAGLFGKYEVRKSDGTPVDPDAVYFTLRIDTDPAARIAAAAYAAACEYTDPELAADLLEVIRSRPRRMHGLARPDVSEADVRRLLIAARAVVKKHTEIGLDRLGVSWSFVNQLEALVMRNACLKCNGRGYIDTRPSASAHVKCDRCDGAGIR